MGSGCEQRGNPCRQAFGATHVLRPVGPARLRVAEAQGSDHLIVGHHRDNERGCRRELPLQERRGAAGSGRIVTIDAGAQGRFPRADDKCRCAGEIVAPDRVGADHGPDFTLETTRPVRGRYAAQRPRFDEVQEVEVSQTGKGLARGTIDRARVDSAGQRRQHTRGR